MPSSKSCSKLEEELTETRKKLAQLQTGDHETHSLMDRDSSSETIRALSHVRYGVSHYLPIDMSQDLGQVTRLSAENYAKYQNAMRVLGDYKKARFVYLVFRLTLTNLF